jgi:peptidoglycan hydrolase-like protein with peptidoglycan-binding domain
MNKITFPLQIGSQGLAVNDLQTALHFLLERAVIFPEDEEARQEFSEILPRDQREQTYEPITAKLVSVFQHQREIEPSGQVDEATAQAINEGLCVLLFT